jgi:hypothetical protein
VASVLTAFLAALHLDSNPAGSVMLPDRSSTMSRSGDGVHG